MYVVVYEVKKNDYDDKVYRGCDFVNKQKY